MRLEQTNDGSLLVIPSGQHQGEETKLISIFVDDYNRTEGVLVSCYGDIDNPEQVEALVFMLGPPDVLEGQCSDLARQIGLPADRRGFLNARFNKSKRSQR